MVRMLTYLRRWNLSRILWVAIGVTFIGAGIAEGLYLMLIPGGLFVILGITRKGCGCDQC